MRLGLLSLLCAAALASAPLGLAGTPAENANAAANLKPLVQKKFKQVAPKLVLTKVTCVTQADGVYVTYKIKAVLHELGGKLTWTTTTHSCIDIKSGKNISC